MASTLLARPDSTDSTPATAPRTWPVRQLVAGVLPALAGLLIGSGMPRGPITPGQVVVGMLACAAVGAGSGYLLRSRWAMLIAPALFALFVELVRVPVTGPSVDRPRLTLFVGLVALVLGRGFGALVQLLPMLLGAAYGAGLARHRSGTLAPGGWHRFARSARRAVAAVASVALLGLAVLLTRPGSTAPIRAADGSRLAGSVAELATVRLGGHDQKVLIRGRSVHNPVLLYLAGGPGQSDLGYTRAYLPMLEKDFVFAVWDQRGTGTSYAALDPARTWTLRQAVADTVQLTNYLRQRFGVAKVYLVGNSWGTLLGVLAAQRNPELYAAFVGAGQMVSVRQSDQVIYRDVLAYAARTGNSALASRMRAWGPPPYSDIYANAFLIEYYDKIGPYTKTRYFESQGPAGTDGTGAREYSPLDKVNKIKEMFDMGAVMYPQLQQLDFRRDAPTLSVPVYLVEGAHELRARLDPAREWFGALRAPYKQWTTFAHSGHIPQFEEAARFHDLLTRTVLAGTGGGR